MSAPDAGNSTAASIPRWCHETSAHDAHRWAESGHGYVCPGVPRNDHQDVRPQRDRSTAAYGRDHEFTIHSPHGDWNVIVSMYASIGEHASLFQYPRRFKARIRSIVKAKDELTLSDGEWQQMDALVTPYVEDQWIAEDDRHAE